MSIDLPSLAAAWRAWLFDEAAPMWAVEGVLPSGGFAEAIGWDGRATGSPLRARVQARQIYVFATLGALGWDGPWRRQVEDGAAFVARAFLRPDGLYRTTVSREGAPLDDTAILYDQAFFLFAAAARTDLSTVTRAETTALLHLDQIEASFAHPAGGFKEASATYPFQSNPHMHLLEAALAWEALAGGARWSRLADSIVELCLTRFIDAESGALREFFNHDWSAASGGAGSRVEPGHQFEWAWLLGRWSRLRGHAGAWRAAERLLRIGLEQGVDRDRDVAVDAIDERLRPAELTARLWPQTERIKATLSLCGEAEKAFEVAAACAGLQRYTDVKPKGLWRDRLRADGSFVQEPAPASSFYHIVCALNELFAAL